MNVSPYTFIWTICVVSAVGIVQYAVAEGTAEVTLSVSDCIEVGIPATIIDEPTAYNGKAISLGDSQHTDFYGGNRTGRGFAEFRPILPRSGKYRLWLRVQWHCTCSRNIAIECSASEIEAVNGIKVLGHIVNVKSVFGPRAWHWVDCGTFEFQRGIQEIALIQAGHFALFDQVALSSEQGYLPPGYFNPEEAFRIEFCPVDWKRSIAERVEYSLGDRVWVNPHLDVSLPMSMSAFLIPRGKLGVEFCQQRDGSSYELSIEASGANIVSSRIYLNQKYMPSKLLAEVDSIDWTGQFHHIQLARIRDEITVKLDGRELIAIKDDTLISGTISLFGESLKQFDFEELVIKEQKSFEELFVGDLQDWDSISGTWRTLVNESGSPTYWGAGGDNVRGISLCRWPLGASSRFTVDFRHVSGGDAGIAFDVVDAENFSAIIVSGEMRGEKELCKLEIAKYVEGKKLVRHSMGLEVTLGQWLRLELGRAPGIVYANIDGERVGPFRIGNGIQSARYGLFVGSEGGAEFASALGRSSYEHGTQEFLFEPETEMRSISAWRLVRGKLRLDQHPATVTLRANPSEGNDVYLQLHSKSVSQTQFRLSIVPTDVREWKNSDVLDSSGALGLSIASGIVLPDEPRFGICLSLEKPERIEYRVGIDTATMRSITVFRNGTMLASDFGSQSSSSQRPELRVQIENGGDLVAGWNSGAEVRVEVPELKAQGREYSVAIFGENLLTNDSLRVDGFSIERMYPILE